MNLFFRGQINKHNVILNWKLKILVHISMLIHPENKLFTMPNVLAKIYHKVNSSVLIFYIFIFNKNNSCWSSVGYSTKQSIWRRGNWTCTSYNTTWNARDWKQPTRSHFRSFTFYGLSRNTIRSNDSGSFREYKVRLRREFLSRVKFVF